MISGQSVVWTGQSLTENAYLSVSSDFGDTYTEFGATLQLPSMLDGNYDTFWHTSEDDLNSDGPQWVKVEFKEAQTVEKVEVFRREANKDRYRDMCIILRDVEYAELDRRCTTGPFGEPYNSESKNSITMIFDPTPGSVGVEIEFNGAEHAQIAELAIQGKKLQYEIQLREFYLRDNFAKSENGSY